MILIGNCCLGDLWCRVGSIGRCGEDRRCTSPTERNLQNRASAKQSRLCNHVMPSFKGDQGQHRWPLRLRREPVYSTAPSAGESEFKCREEKGVSAFLLGDDVLAYALATNALQELLLRCVAIVYQQNSANGAKPSLHAPPGKPSSAGFFGHSSYENWPGDSDRSFLWNKSGF